MRKGSEWWNEGVKVKVEEKKRAFEDWLQSTSIEKYEKYREKNVEVKRKAHVDKAYDRIPRKVMFWCLRKRKVPEKLVKMVEMIYKITRTEVITVLEKQKFLKLVLDYTRGQPQARFYLSILDVFSDWNRNEELLELLYAYDFLITVENEEELQRRVIE
ncbi:uncharacterized protein [Palaemon carinicauda]|uniref:uncharacterized protein n=1 Tax=Palaemon carinicauda TaxID=392227 RepID=UPI0035B5BC43